MVGGEVGVTWIVATGDAVRTTDPVMLLMIAEMLVVPVVKEVTIPFEPGALLTVATAVFDDVHVADDDRSVEAWFEYVPIALN